ncbi:MAG: cyclodeaminase/cyclohydrolase family protein [Clostridia bacterium]|nr:cyclodeaminase/cyclohydrolase family protein [Clostridia bacterium]
MTTKEFAACLASDAPAPGGGSAAALIGAYGAALTTMVGQLSQRETGTEALMEELFTAADRDTEAFLQVAAAFAMPKQTEAEKLNRSAAIQAGLRTCTESPLAVMEKALQALRQMEELERAYNTNAASDLGVAVLAAQTALKGAWLNVLINVASLKDRQQAALYRERGQQLLAAGEQLAAELYERILKAIEA